MSVPARGSQLLVCGDWFQTGVLVCVRSVAGGTYVREKEQPGQNPALVSADLFDVICLCRNIAVGHVDEKRSGHNGCGHHFNESCRADLSDRRIPNF